MIFLEMLPYVLTRQRNSQLHILYSLVLTSDSLMLSDITKKKAFQAISRVKMDMMHTNTIFRVIFNVI